MPAIAGKLRIGGPVKVVKVTLSRSVGGREFRREFLLAYETCLPDPYVVQSGAKPCKVSVFGAVATLVQGKELLGGDLQVLVSASGNYQGDMRNRETQACLFSDFMASLNQGAEAGTEQLYLAQAPMYSESGSNAAPLRDLLEDITLPRQLATKENLASVNLWMASRYLEDIVCSHYPLNPYSVKRSTAKANCWPCSCINL